jgi:hypothetical protein
MTKIDLSEGLVIADTRHPGTKHFRRLFAYAHLRAPASGVAASCAWLAQEMVDSLADGPELTAGLRKLKEAKDCFVIQALGL